MRFITARIFTIAAFAAVSALFGVRNAHGQLHDGNPFGIASGAEWSGDYPKFEPMLSKAEVGWLRYFPEWHALQPKQGEWDWKRADEFVAQSKANGIQLTAPLAYFAPWASSGNDTRTFPVKDMQYWRDFVGGVVGRYKGDIRFWEMWNEPQAFQKKGTPQMYAEMVRAGYEAAKKADPKAQVGLTSANFAVAYLDMVLRAGAKDHFDYVCVHPYENMEMLTRPGGEVYFLSMAGNLRRLLAAHQQRADLPLWVTEIGWQAPIKAEAEKDAVQAQVLAKCYVLLLAQGFEKVFWFEARGPAYGKGTDHGIIRQDWSERPAYDALKVMTAQLGEAPKYEGWMDFLGRYAFVFSNGGKYVLAAWSPAGKEGMVRSQWEATVTSLDGTTKKLGVKEPFKLTNEVVFITGMPTADVAKANREKPFPWGGDFTKTEEVGWRAGEAGAPRGLEPMETVAVEKLGEDSVVRVRKGGGMSLRANPGFAPYGTKELEIKIVARRAPDAKEAGFQLFYETLKTIHGYDRAGWWTVPAGDGWQEHTYRVNDANFVGTWGYNLSLTEVNGDLLIKEVSVKKVGEK